MHSKTVRKESPGRTLAKICLSYHLQTCLMHRNSDVATLGFKVRVCPREGAWVFHRRHRLLVPPSPNMLVTGKVIVQVCYVAQVALGGPLRNASQKMPQPGIVQPEPPMFGRDQVECGRNRVELRPMSIQVSPHCQCSAKFGPKSAHCGQRPKSARHRQKWTRCRPKELSCSLFDGHLTTPIEVALGPLETDPSRHARHWRTGGLFVLTRGTHSISAVAPRHASGVESSG